MGKICKKSWIAGIFLGVMLFAAGFAFQATTIDAQAASTGFRTVGGQTFYYKKGKKVKGWVTVKGKKYFLNRKTGALYKGWMKSSKGRRRYFDQKTGAMYTGFNKIAGQYYYFNKKTGFTVSGFVKFGTNFYRYFDTKKYTMATGWMTNSKNQKWYFGSDGKMYRGLKKIGSYKYYFDGKTGAAKYGFITSSKGYTRYFRKKYYRMATGWMTSSKGKKRYFAKNGVMATGKKTISGSTYYFNTGTGIATGGWVTIDGSKYYFDTKTFKMVTGSNKKMNKLFRSRKTSIKIIIKRTSRYLILLSLNVARLTANSPSSTHVLYVIILANVNNRKNASFVVPVILCTTLSRSR